MAKKNDSLVSLLTRLPWWMNLLLAPLAYVFLSRVVPAILGDNPFVPALAPAFAFVGVAAGGVSSWASGSLVRRPSRKRRLLDRQTGLDSIRALSWREFEERVGVAYRRDGYRVLENDQPGSDSGVDIRLRSDGELHLVHSRTGAAAASASGWGGGLRRPRRRARAPGRPVCSGHFTGDARRFAAGEPIRLVDGDALLALVRGVQRTVYPRCGGRLVERTARHGEHAPKPTDHDTQRSSCVVNEAR